MASVFVIFYFVSAATGSSQKEVTLNAQRTSGNGAVLVHNRQSTTISDGNFEINVKDQAQDYDMKLSLDASWGFVEAEQSSIVL